MNRLWVRLSLAYTLLFIIVAVCFFAFFFFATSGPPDGEIVDSRLTSAQLDALNLLAREGVLRVMVRSLFSVQVIILSVVAVIAGVLGSIGLSYRMTRPLIELEEATRKVGQRDLGYRVETTTNVREMVALADAFNVMAEGLDSAEKRRQNLLSDVSHELRTPLTVLQGNLRNALDGVVTLDPPQLATLYDQTRQLNHLVNDLHDLAQVEANRLSLSETTVDLHQLVMQVGELFGPLAQEGGIEIIVDSKVSQAMMKGDRARMMQILQNLISNALRYAKSEVRLVLHSDAEQHLLEVIDNGSGIAPEELAHIFNRFYRIDESRARSTGGSGLGLAIVKSLVNVHGGVISAESTPNSHTRFCLSFPAT